MGNLGGYGVIITIFLSPCFAALMTGLIAKSNERTLSGITTFFVLWGSYAVIFYDFVQIWGWSYELEYHKWDWIVGLPGTVVYYFIGRWLGYLSVKLKGKKQVEQDIYLDFDKKMDGYFAKLFKKPSK